jgi:predicted nuclease of restriction endonuclease-like RecB superfamily
VLTADLVNVRRRGGELRLLTTDAGRRARIEALAARLTAVAREQIGRSRDALDDAFATALAGPQDGQDGQDGQDEGDGPAAGAAARGAAAGTERRLAAGVLKLVKDGCRFEETDSEAAVTLRRTLFREAAALRATATGGFDRAAVMSAVATAGAVTPAEIETRLFGDRPGAQRLLAVEVPAPAALAARFPLAEAQAVLLRAKQLRARVRAGDALRYRRLFRTLKFLRLLPVVRADGTGGYLIELDGPLSLFHSGTRYGLQLGLSLSAIAECDRWSIEAEVLWGTARHPLLFKLAGDASTAGPPASRDADGPALPDELQSFVSAFERLPSGWRIEREPAVLDLPGVGLCVPDLAFVRDRDGVRVFFELLGFWSREAVWRRVELARAGLPHRILFAASKTLRVGEAVLDDAPGAALYVFSRVLSAKEILTRIEALATERAADAPSAA